MALAPRGAGVFCGNPRPPSRLPGRFRLGRDIHAGDQRHDQHHFQVVRRVAEGFDSGWHIHPGPAIVQVQEGSVDIYQGSCTPKTLGPGDTYIEVPHMPVRAVATGHFAWTTTFIINGSDPLQIPWSTYGGGSPNPCP